MHAVCARNVLNSINNTLTFSSNPDVFMNSNHVIKSSNGMGKHNTKRLIQFFNPQFLKSDMSIVFYYF